MHPNFDNACQNVVNHVSNAHTAFAGHSVACVDATSKRLLGRKRLSTQRQTQPGDTQSGDRPDMRSPRDSMSRGERLALPTRSLRTQTWVAADATAAVKAAATGPAGYWPAGNEPAAIWAALVIARALAS
jgi:hypothetical protein